MGYSSIRNIAKLLCDCHFYMACPVFHSGTMNAVDSPLLWFVTILSGVLIDIHLHFEHFDIHYYCPAPLLSFYPISLHVFSFLFPSFFYLAQTQGIAEVKQVSEGSPRMELCEKTPRKQDRNLVTSVSWKTENYLWNAFLCSSQGWHLGLIYFRLFITTDYSYLFRYLYGKICFCHIQPIHHMQLALVIGNPSLNPRSVNHRMLWIKLVIAWDFSLPYLWTPLSQVPLPRERWMMNRWAVCLRPPLVPKSLFI